MVNESGTPLQQRLRFAMLVAATGGFLDAYSILNAGVFAGAQTGNIVIAAVHLSAREWDFAVRAAVPILAYASGSVIGAGLGLQRVRRVIRDPVKAALVIEILFLIVAGLLPTSGSRLPLAIMLSLAGGLQMAVFPRVRAWGYSTTVMTSNITKWMTGAVRHLGDHEAPARSEALTFAGVVFSFAAGAVATGVARIYLGAGTIVLAIMVLLAALAWLLLWREPGNTPETGEPSSPACPPSAG